LKTILRFFYRFLLVGCFLLYNAVLKKRFLSKFDNVENQIKTTAILLLMLNTKNQVATG